MIDGSLSEPRGVTYDKFNIGENKRRLPDYCELSKLGKNAAIYRLRLLMWWIVSQWLLIFTEPC